MTEFSRTYADAYDALYHDKDYAAECALIERVVRASSDLRRPSLLDLGCGTGNHSLLLAQAGFEVLGVDRSEEMLSHARRKAEALPAAERPVFLRGDLCSLHVDRTVDAALMMFAVLGYQKTNPEVTGALGAARARVRRGGQLIFDVWYGPAVTRERPSQRIKVVPVPGGQVLRVASASLDERHHLCAVHYHLWCLSGDRLVAETEETHGMRYFFPLELDHLLETAGWKLRRLGAFPDIDREPTLETWNVLGIAEAV